MVYVDQVVLEFCPQLVATFGAKMLGDDNVTLAETPISLGCDVFPSSHRLRTHVRSIRYV